MVAASTLSRVRMLLVALIAAALNVHASPLCAQVCGSWTLVAQEGPPPTGTHAIAYDSIRDVMVLFGGTATNNGFLRETWEWNGEQWTLVSEDGPAARRRHAMSYDSSRGVTVLFGGLGENGRFGDTWEWDGSTWTLASESGPMPRHTPVMEYDAARGVTVMFGGSSNGGLLGDTWEWDGVTWTRVATSGPAPRWGHGMAYDAARGVMVMCHGYDGSWFRDTWEWDGALWRRVSLTGPAARSSFDMAFDTVRGRTIMYGGWDGNALFDDTWEWSGTEWRRIAETGPGARTNHAMDYNIARNVIVLYGGGDGNQGNNETWAWAYEFSIIGQPQDQTVPGGQPTQFTVEVSGPGSPLYQWRRNGEALVDGGSISGSTTDTLSISPVSRGDAGLYDCVVTGECGSITSDTARLTVIAPLLSIDPSCPGGGAIRIAWTDAWPGGQVALLFALNSGRFTTPNGYPCAGTRLGLGSNQIQIGWQGGAGAEGSRTINGSAGPNACGGYMQLIDLTSCATSNVVRVE